MELAANTRQVLSLGKKVIEDLYIHLDYLKEVREAPDFGPLIDAGMDLMIKEDLENCNVLKINLHKQKLSFLQYLNFESDPFPTLNGSWTVDPQKGTVSFRSYSSSLNPPILHRKELLVHVDHPGRYKWVAVTKTAEDLGLFATSSPIGFRENWERVIAAKGFRLENGIFCPLGNQTDEDDQTTVSAQGSQVQRHLTALSRNSLSAPMQLLIGHGLINDQITVFDYGCGRGDDIRGLESAGIRCTGWDPHYAQGNPLLASEIVNLGFVVNVIEDPAERVEAVQKAFSLASTALAVSVMLHTSDRPGRPYRDGFLTARNTFQKYFSQDEFKDYLEHVLAEEPIMIGPGIALVFKDKDAEQRFLMSRYRSSNVARRLLSARVSPRLTRLPRVQRVRAPRITKSEREFAELRPMLDVIWSQILDLGRFPEVHEVTDLRAIEGVLNFV